VITPKPFTPFAIPTPDLVSFFIAPSTNCQVDQFNGYGKLKINKNLLFDLMASKNISL